MDVDSSTRTGYRGIRGVLWDGEVARSWHRFRVIASLVSLVAGLLLAAWWGWPGGLATAALALIPLVDGLISLRSRRPGTVHSIAIDTTAIGLAMVVVGLEPAAVGAPFLYMVLVATLFLPARRALLGAGYAAVWSAVAFAPIELVVMPESASPGLITGIAYGIFSSHIVALLAVLARSVERSAIARSDALERLERAAESKDRFLASISHEIRTPLTSVVGFANLLSESELPPQIADMVSVVAREAHEVEYIVEDLLVAARADLGTISLAADRTDLKTTAASAMIGLGMRVKVQSLASGDVAALADETRVRQILRVLLTNAFRYGGPDVAVTVGASADLVRLAVSDDGPGVPSGDVDRIFDPYHRAHDIAGQPEAMGLGLYVARHLAHLMGGDLIHRREFERTTFILSLPRFVGPDAGHPVGVADGGAVHFRRNRAAIG